MATNMLSEIPWIGSSIKTFLRAGTEMGTLTLSRFFVLHVFFVPALLIAAVAAHLFLFRRAGAAGPPVTEEERRRLPTEPFYPRQVFKDFAFGILLIAVLAVLALWKPASLGPVANPADPTYVPRPEWYYIPVFQWLKYWHGRWSLVGIVLIPALIFLALFALPLLDRSRHRAPLRRPLPVATFMVILGSLFFLGYRSHIEDRRDPAILAKLLAQEDAERQFARSAFEPEEAGGARLDSRTSAAQKLTPQEAKGALLFESESCSACHGPGGRGGAGLNRLSGLKDRYKPEELTRLLRAPRPPMLEGGMEASKLPDTDLQALVAYLQATMNETK